MYIFAVYTNTNTSYMVYKYPGVMKNCVSILLYGIQVYKRKNNIYIKLTIKFYRCHLNHDEMKSIFHH